MSPEPTPPLGRWRRLYALVIGVLILDIVLLWIFAQVFA